MNAELVKVENWLQGIGKSPESYSELSKDNKGTSLVSNDTKEAYNYDSIVKWFFVSGTDPCCCSCDALLLRENLYFIEFKRTKSDIDLFDQNIGNISNTRRRSAGQSLAQ